MTYEELLDQIQGKGQSWSQWDLETARKNPSFGASMLTYKQDWAEATDQAGRTAANQAAEALRRQYGSYLGGSDGSKYYGLGGPGSYQSGYQDRISQILDEMDNYRDFDYGPAPTYNNRYQETLDELLGQVQNYGPFTWSKEEDPAYSAYAKQYRREGQRATADAMAQAAALTGGQVSTAAATAASQAGDYYAGQLADVIPQLYENAYQRYLSDYSLLADQLGQVRQAEQLDYAKYLDELGQYNADRNLSYDQWLQGYNMLSGNLSAFQGQDQTEYGRLLDQIEYNMQQDALDRELAAEQQNLYQAQVDAILSAGGTPSDALVGPSGYSDEYVNALRAYYAAQAAPSGGGGYDNYYEYEEEEDTQSSEGESGQEMNPDHYRATANAIVAQIESGRPEAAVGTLDARWDELSESQREGLQRLLETYGYYYEREES
ncbi:MAG TPA: hypothetical protein H9839_04310 [Candidatus Intestinimonas stercorigallinarum]|nr:hypothetical protein [Candidatus Intestinimonas stercorigallinarum]